MRHTLLICLVASVICGACDSAPPDATDSLEAPPTQDPKATGLKAPGVELGSAPETMDRPFAFLSGTQPVEKALQTLYDVALEAPTPDTAKELFTRRLAALRDLQDNAEAAAKLIVEELSRKDADDIDALMSGFYLLGEFQNQAGVDYLYERAVKQLPDVEAASMTHDDRNPMVNAVRLRLFATDQIVRLAVGQKNLRALGALLDLVKEGDTDVQNLAIRGYYSAVGPGQRSKAKRALRKLLPGAKQHLVHAIY